VVTAGGRHPGRLASLFSCRSRRRTSGQSAELAKIKSLFTLQVFGIVGNNRSGRLVRSRLFFTHRQVLLSKGP
jgi:hypothetical protein